MTSSFESNRLRGTLEQRMKVSTKVDFDYEPRIPVRAKIEINTKQKEMSNEDFVYCCERLSNLRVRELGLTGYDLLDWTLPYKIQRAKGCGFDNIYMSVTNLGNIDKCINCGLTSVAVKCDADDYVKIKRLLQLEKDYPLCEFSILTDKESDIDEIKHYIKTHFTPIKLNSKGSSKIKVYYKPSLVVDKHWKYFNCLHINVQGYIVPSFERQYKNKVMGKLDMSRTTDIWNSPAFIKIRSAYNPKNKKAETKSI